MNHKRKKPKHQRAGCLVCKPQKDERRSKQQKSLANRQVLKVILADEDLRDGRQQDEKDGQAELTD